MDTPEKIVQRMSHIFSDESLPFDWHTLRARRQSHDSLKHFACTEEYLLQLPSLVKLHGTAMLDTAYEQFLASGVVRREEVDDVRWIVRTDPLPPHLQLIAFETERLPAYVRPGERSAHLFQRTAELRDLFDAFTPSPAAG